MTGLHLAHYRIDAELGRGGMGIVYRATDTKLERTVALKVLPASALRSEDDRTRFFREAKASAQLSHAHVCHVYEVGEAAPHKADLPPAEGAELRPFIAMEYVDGESLAARVAKGPLKVEEVVRLASEIASALGAAHEAGIVHRDVKSGNVMLTSKGEAKVLDFGLAKTAASTQLTRQGSTLGTVAYMSPEQARGADVDRRTDLWALGVVIYEMVAGRLPFAADYDQAALYAILNEDPEPLTAVRTGVPMELEAIVEKLLRKEAGQRYQTTGDLLADLAHLAHRKGSGVSTSGQRSGLSAVRTSPAARKAGLQGIAWPYWLVGGAIVGIVLSLMLGLLGGVRPATDARPTVENLRRAWTDEAEEITPAISPDGRLVAFLSRTGGRSIGLFVRQVSGSNPLQLAADLNLSVYSAPAWVPDGSGILVMSHATDGTSTIYEVPALGGAAVHVVSGLVAGYSANGPRPFENSVAFPASSVDGSRLAFVRDDSLVIRGLEDSSERVFFVAGETWDLEWSPDGRYVVSVSGNHPYVAYNQAPSSIWLTDVESGTSVLLSDQGGVAVSPTWDKAGAGVFFVSDHGGGQDVYWVPVEDGKAAGPEVRVTTGMQAYTVHHAIETGALVVSSARLSQNLWRVSRNASVMQTPADAVRMTTGSQVVEGLAVSRDRSRLAYDSNRSGNSEVYVRDLATGLETQVTSNESNDFVFSWGAGDGSVFVHSFRNGNRDLFEVHLSDLSVETVAASPTHERFPSASPAGNAVVYNYANGVMAVARRSASGGWDQTVNADVSGGYIWSPIDDNLVLVRKDGGGAELRDAEGSVVRDLGPAGRYHFWMPDGHSIGYIASAAGVWSDEETIGNSNWVIVERNLDTDGERILFDSAGSMLGFHIISASAEHVYFTVREVDVDLWFLDVESYR